MNNLVHSTYPFSQCPVSAAAEPRFFFVVIAPFPLTCISRCSQPPFLTLGQFPRALVEKTLRRPVLSRKALDCREVPIRYGDVRPSESLI